MSVTGHYSSRGEKLQHTSVEGDELVAASRGLQRSCIS